MSENAEATPAKPEVTALIDLGQERARVLEHCQVRIGYKFRNVDLLREALTHSSIASHRLASNERLEFLGDSVLGLVVCRWLFDQFPQAAEGELTRIKSAVVSRRCCARVAKRLELEDFLIVGKGLALSQGVPSSLLSDVFEAVVAAIFLDGGLEVVTRWVQAHLEAEIADARRMEHGGNYKSALQQRTQQRSGGSATYRLLNECGPDHNKLFCVTAVVAKQEFTPAWGANKKEAEQRAAANALAEIEGREPPFTPEPAEECEVDDDEPAT